MREGFNQAQLRIEALAIYFLKLIRIMSHVIAVLAVMLSFISTEAQGFSLLTNTFHFLPSALTVPISGLFLMLLGFTTIGILIRFRIVPQLNPDPVVSSFRKVLEALAWIFRMIAIGLSLGLISLTPGAIAYFITMQYWGPIIAMAASILACLPTFGFYMYLIILVGDYLERRAEIQEEHNLATTLAISKTHGGQAALQLAEWQIKNNPQTTHKASIHESASESAQWLKEQYQSKLISVQLMTTHFKAYVDKETEKHSSETQKDKKYRDKLDVARKGFDFVINKLSFLFDPTSGIQSRTLLQLVWMFIHDQQKSSSTAADLLPRLIDGLYDIQRGDDGKPICFGGAFNKLIESVTGCNDHCKLIVIALDTATVKLPRVVREEAFKYLKSLPKEKLCTTLKQIKHEDMSVESILPSITSSVETTMWDEFQSVFIRGNCTKAQSFLEFQTFVAAGAEYTTLTSEEFTELETGMLTQATPAAALLSSSIRAATHDSTPQPPKSELQQHTCFRR
jgi:hypothetical protein